MHTDMVYHVFTKINFHIHVHTRDVPNCILRCNTLDCKIDAHQYGLPCIYKNKFSYRYIQEMYQTVSFDAILL